MNINKLKESEYIKFVPQINTAPWTVELDEEGNPNIDIDDTRKSRNPVDIKIPLNKENALKIFNGEDYELEWAIDYLNKKSS